MQQYIHSHSLALVSIAASEDAALLSQWESHLRPLEQVGLISVWSGRHLVPGADRLQAFQHQLDTANIILLLLSADFFNSPDCLAMMEQALWRSRTDKVRVIPLLLRSVAWQESPLAELTPWPSNGVPITQWRDQDAAWDSCVLDLRRLLGRRVSPTLAGGSASKHTDPDWERMLRRLRQSYKELLDQSLHGISWVELGLANKPEAVSNVTNLLFRLPQGSERLLALGTSMLDAYDEAEGELLILGAPGSGKSTLLLNLAGQLVDQAQTGEIDQLPIILRLSSWAIGQPALANWMSEQLSRTYDVPRTLSECWVQGGRVLPLLDGLDEMDEQARPACIAAINAYHQDHLAPLVVCSRSAEYEAATQHERLALQSAVIIQPLSNEQIEGYLRVAGPNFAGIHTALHRQGTLWELATTPLMLSVLLLTYKGKSAEGITKQGIELEQQVWTDYIARMVQEKGNVPRYPLERTRTWLSWLAQQMQMHQPIFYAEHLETNWLPFEQQRSVIPLTTYLPAFLLGACACLLVFTLLGSIFDVGGIVQWGVIGGGIGGYVSHFLTGEAREQISSLKKKRHICQHLGPPALFGGLLAVSQILFFFIDNSYSVLDPIWWSGLFGLGAGLSFWIFQEKLSPPLDHTRSQKSTHSLWHKKLFSWTLSIASSSIWRAAAWMGGGIGLSVGLNYGLDAWLRNGLSSVLNIGLVFGLGYGISIFITVILAYAILRNAARPLQLAERIHWNWRHAFPREHLRTSLTITGVLFLFFGLSAGLSIGLSTGLSDGLSHGLIFGLSYVLSGGLSHGLIFGLSYLILLGLYQGIRQEHLDDYYRHSFNQGIHRSSRNGLFLAVISACIITTIGVLSIVLNNGLSDGLSYGLIDGISIGLNDGLRNGLSIGLHGILTLFITSLILLWMLSSGRTILRHYVIRALLARHQIFPFRAQAFLDDATSRSLLPRVGGGYETLHHRLQDYFAEIEAAQAEQ